MGDKFNYFIDNLNAVFLRFLELPFFFIFLTLILAFVSLYCVIRFLFGKRINSRLLKKISLLFLVIITLILFDKKFNAIKKEITIVNQKVEQSYMNSTKENSASNSINFRPQNIRKLYPNSTIYSKVLNESMTLVTFKKNNPLARVYITIIDLTHPRLEIKMDENISTKTLTSKFGKKYNCEVAVNGEAGESPDLNSILGEWKGNYFVKGKRILQEDSELRPFLSFNRNNKGKYFEAKITDTAYAKERYNTIYGRFDVLVNNKVSEDFMQRPYTRTVIGIDSNGTQLYLMVVDGKRPEYSLGITYEECGNIMKSIGAYNAMACDQGGSSAMYLKSINGLINRPADSDGMERPVYTHFGISLY